MSPRRRSEFDISMSLKVELGETTHITPSIDVYRELTEKVDDRRRAIGQREPQNEWCEHDRQELLREDQNLHGK